MPRKATSQWDLGGDLFGPSRTGRPASTVSELTARVKDAVEGGFALVRVRGEVSNYRLQPSGHAYFVLKDAGAALSCVLFRGQAAAGRGALRDGASVVLEGSLTVYEARGQYQLRVSGVEAEGVGALQAAFEELKRRLAAEGLFEAARKRPIPTYPRGVGIVTSSAGAALRDVLHVMGRRHGGMELWLAPARVQGQGAAREVAAGIELLNRWHAQGAPVDVILVTRGGGSLEDLWAFNEEILARAIAASALPVVSAVGHEIDFTIADFVADMRAATPSAAAELLTAAYVAARAQVADMAVRLPRLAWNEWESRSDEAMALGHRLARLHPRRLLEAQGQRLDDVLESMRRAVVRGHREAGLRVASAARRLGGARPLERLGREQARMEELRRRLTMAAGLGRRGASERLAGLAGRLRLLSPQSVLDRGYSITTDAETGLVVREAAGLKAGQRLATRLAKGVVHGVVTRVESPSS
ncbi:MAG: exodeoxyribonuclease VII large subunit [Verrucomicrobiota bacterium]|jgi:exodeoxyribonuclease VII large subunit